MKTNIAILLIISILTYALTLYLSENSISPRVKDVPDKSSIQKDVQDEQQIPQFEFTDLNGGNHKSGDFKDKIIILNFWASWCAPCIKEFPNLLKINDEYKDSTILIALSSDLDQNAITKFINKMEASQNVNFEAPNIFIAHDEDQKITAKLFNTFKLPETIIIDQNQNIRHKLIGADWDENDLRQIIKELK